MIHASVRSARVILTLSAVLAASLLFHVSAASAQSVYPRGCPTIAHGAMLYPTGGSNAPGDWNPNCYVGDSSAYLENANYVLGVQYLIQSNGYGCGANDGYDGEEGPITNAGVKCWQKARGLSQDGVVGPNTWQSLGFHTLYDPVLSGHYYYYLVFSEGNMPWFAKTNGNTNNWWVWNMGQDGNDGAGPENFFFGLDTSTPGLV